MRIDCTLYPESLLELELWGDGSSSSAPVWSKACLELAQGGTLFLDEISALNTNVQTRLLSLLDSGALGCRLLCSTARDLTVGPTFDPQLYQRFVRLELPELRRREGDLPLLTDYFYAPKRRAYRYAFAQAGSYRAGGAGAVAVAGERQGTALLHRTRGAVRPRGYDHCVHARITAVYFGASTAGPTSPVPGALPEPVLETGTSVLAAPPDRWRSRSVTVGSSRTGNDPAHGGIDERESDESGTHVGDQRADAVHLSF